MGELGVLAGRWLKIERAEQNRPARALQCVCVCLRAFAGACVRPQSSSYSASVAFRAGPLREANRIVPGDEAFVGRGGRPLCTRSLANPGRPACRGAGWAAGGALRTTSTARGVNCVCVCVCREREAEGGGGAIGGRRAAHLVWRRGADESPAASERWGTDGGEGGPSRQKRKAQGLHGGLTNGAALAGEGSKVGHLTFLCLPSHNMQMRDLQTLRPPQKKYAAIRSARTYLRAHRKVRVEGRCLCRSLPDAGTTEVRSLRLGYHTCKQRATGNRIQAAHTHTHTTRNEGRQPTTPRDANQILTHTSKEQLPQCWHKCTDLRSPNRGQASSVRRPRFAGESGLRPRAHDTLGFDHPPEGLRECSAPGDHNKCLFESALLNFASHQTQPRGRPFVAKHRRR